MYIRDVNRFLVFKPGDEIKDEKFALPAVQDTVYGGHYNDKLQQLLALHRGNITLEMLMKDIIPQISMKSNFHNVIYAPRDLKFWVNNAASKSMRAAEQPYTYFDLQAALNWFEKQ